MVPYILALLFLIIMILWQVYSQSEGFETKPVLTKADYSITGNDTVGKAFDIFTQMTSKWKELDDANTKVPVTPLVTDLDKASIGTLFTDNGKISDLSSKNEFNRQILLGGYRVDEILTSLKQNYFPADVKNDETLYAASKRKIVSENTGWQAQSIEMNSKMYIDDRINELKTNINRYNLLADIYNQSPNITLSSAIADYVNKLSALVMRLEALQTKVSSSVFTPKYSESELLTIFGAPPSSSPPDLSTSEKLAKFLTGIINRYKNDIDLIKTNPPTAEEEQLMLSKLPDYEKKVAYFENIYVISTAGSTTTSLPSTTTTSSSIPPPPPPSSTYTTTSSMPTMTTTSTATSTGEPKLMVNIYDLWGALGPFSAKKGDGTITTTATGDVVSSLTGGAEKKTTAADASGAEVPVDVTKPKETPKCSEPAAAEKESEVLTKELEERLSKNIVKQIKDDLISQHQLQGAYDDMCPYAPSDVGVSTDGIGQGYEFQQMRPQLMTQQTAPVYQPTVNMNDYIRKDSIPCAKCNLSS